MKYFLGILGEHRYELTLIDRKRGKQWAYFYAFSPDAVESALADVRAMWSKTAERELWALVYDESPDTLCEAHEFGWVDEFRVRAFVIIRAHRDSPSATWFLEADLPEDVRPFAWVQSGPAVSAAPSKSGERGSTRRT